jgi:hypothetical protein
MIASDFEKTPIITSFTRIKAAMITEYSGPAISSDVKKRFSLITLVLNFKHRPIPNTAACFFPRIFLKSKQDTTTRIAIETRNDQDSLGEMTN